MTLRGAVVVGGHVNGLGVVRSLASLGIPVACISTRSFDLAHSSRAVSERVELPEFHAEPETLLELLEARRKSWRNWALFSTNDDSLAALSLHRERLASDFRPTVPHWEKLAPLLDKYRMHVLATRVGLDVPRCYGEATEETAARDDLRYPLIVKPLRHERLIERYGVKVFLAADRRELLHSIECLENARSRGLVFETIPGADDCIFVYCVYVDRNGEPSRGLTVRKWRQNPPGTGSARVAQAVADPPGIREASVELLRQAEFRGMAFVEFKRDPQSKRLRFIEVNGRAVLFNSLLQRADLDLVRATWEDFVLDTPPRLDPSEWRGYWIHLQSDLLCSALFGRSEGLTPARFLAPYRAPHVYAVWSARDPLPFAVQSGRMAWEAITTPLRAEARQALRQRLRGGRSRSG